MHINETYFKFKSKILKLLFFEKLKRLGSNAAKGKELFRDKVGIYFF